MVRGVHYGPNKAQSRVHSSNTSLIQHVRAYCVDNLEYVANYTYHTDITARSLYSRINALQQHMIVTMQMFSKRKAQHDKGGGAVEYVPKVCFVETVPQILVFCNMLGWVVTGKPSIFW